MSSDPNVLEKSDMQEADSPLTEADFLSCGWQNALEPTKKDGWLAVWYAFSIAAKQATDAGEGRKARVLSLLAHACSMALAPASANEPFVPKFVAADGRSSASLDGLSDADVKFFALISDEIDHPQLKARLADIVWTKLRRFPYALTAVDAYRSLPLDVDTWINNGRASWERAISLCMRLKVASAGRLQEIETALLDAFHGATDKDGFFSLWIADVLDQYGRAKDKSGAIATQLMQLGDAFNLTTDVHRTTAYYSAACDWFTKSGDTKSACAAKVKTAMAFANDAAEKSSGETPSFIVGAMQYEKAIHQLRKIPNAQRADFGATELIEKYHRAMSEAQRQSMGQLETIATKAVDLEDWIRASREAVSGRNCPDALAGFVSLSTVASAARLRNSAEKRCRESLFGNLFGSTYLSSDGRVVARQSPAGFNRDAPPDEFAVFEQMVFEYRIRIELVATGRILPALEILTEEHHLRERDFVAMASQSSAVPSGRERLFGKAFFYGIEGDFVAAMHVLVPQLENMVRYHLKQAGAKTTTLDGQGIEMENGMSTLIELPQMVDIFGEDMTFELKALFCSQLGPNFRNQLAHGLLDDTACFSLAALYAWWLGLKIVYSEYWAQQQSPTDASSVQPAA